MQGTTKPNHLGTLKRGITPACAGKSTRYSSHNQRDWDHPRVCGEKSSSMRFSACRMGSPPRVRGKDLSLWCILDTKGITPACAGKRETRPGVVPLHRDHPRVCGEKCFGVICSIHFIGSPPRVRGKDILQGARQPLLRITPACAGKRARSAHRRSACWDHPRVCGEKPRSSHSNPRRVGSPPRVRGKGRIHIAGNAHAGITPAYAGKSSGGARADRGWKDHPRACGEKGQVREHFKVKEGSPPRMRGKGSGFPSVGCSRGITPAYAGKSAERTASAAGCRDHPRVCGEK